MKIINRSQQKDLENWLPGAKITQREKEKEERVKKGKGKNN